ncbi:MAG: polymer-forming cytoskeletal protein [Thermodesulfobacteriota bacterium]|nr:polymer-forming cytoskeletal protein [Thermodesulfobacteriota bacterium]
MSFFKKNDNNPEMNFDGNNVAISSIIGNGMNFTGNVNFTGKLRLDGSIEGNVKGDHLVMGETGSITGDVDIDTFICQGRVQGNIKACNLNVVKGCRIDGNVEAVNLLVEGGASLNGEVKVETSDLRLLKGGAPEEEQEEAIAQAAH